MHAENAKNTTGLAQAAADHLLKVGDTSEAPRFHIRAAEQIHTDEDIDWSNDVSLSQDRFNCPNDLRVVLVVPVGFDSDLLHVAGKIISAAVTASEFSGNTRANAWVLSAATRG
jgi:hypothetical protein